MNNWTLAGIIALAVVVIAGSIIKYITHSKLKELDGTYEPVPDEAAKAESVIHGAVKEEPVLHGDVKEEPVLHGDVEEEPAPGMAEPQKFI